VTVQAEHGIVLDQKDLTVLLFNAVKHGCVKSARVEMTCDETNQLRISVIDQGAGLDPDTIWEKAKEGSGFSVFASASRFIREISNRTAQGNPRGIE